MWSSVETQFAIEHPTAKGHFPGDPIIPGAVLLDEVVRAVAASLGAADGPCEIRSAKFLRPVRPGERITIRWRAGDETETRFECLLLDPPELALNGVIKLPRPAV
jgi:3-hydroxymyristoyl/3-hydroxydecanoyl-(acyl carrier protein) dehydratase